MASHFTHIIRNDLKLAFRRHGGITNLLAFFLVITALFPLALGADSKMLNQIGTGIIWVAALLVSNLSINRIFEEDLETGILEQLILHPLMPHTLVLAKAFSHWLSCGLPITIFSPILAVMFLENPNSIYLLILSLLLGTPILSLICTMGAGITLGVKRGGTLASLLVTPIYIPTLIFGCGLVQSTAFGLDSEQVASNIAGLVCILLIMLPLCVWSTSVSIKISLEE